MQCSNVKIISYKSQKQKQYFFTTELSKLTGKEVDALQHLVTLLRIIMGFHPIDVH